MLLNASGLLMNMKRTALLLTLFALAGCASRANAVTRRPPTFDRVIIPPCTAAIAGQGSQWTGGNGVPGNTSALLGFTPYVFSDIPATVTFSANVGFSAQYSDGLAPLFHGAYGRWEPQPYNAVALENVIAVDETPAHLGLLANMSSNGTALQVTNQSKAVVNGESATLFHFVSLGNDTQSVAGIGLLWQHKTLTSRITVVTSGEYQMTYPNSSAAFDWIRPWPGVSGQSLLSLASNLVPLPHC